MPKLINTRSIYCAAGAQEPYEFRPGTDFVDLQVSVVNPGAGLFLAAQQPIVFPATTGILVQYSTNVGDSLKPTIRLHKSLNKLWFHSTVSNVTVLINEYAETP